MTPRATAPKRPPRIEDHLACVIVDEQAPTTSRASTRLPPTAGQKQKTNAARLVFRECECARRRLIRSHLMRRSAAQSTTLIDGESVSRVQADVIRRNAKMTTEHRPRRFACDSFGVDASIASCKPLEHG